MPLQHPTMLCVALETRQGKRGQVEMGRRTGDGVNMDERWSELEWIPRFIVFCFFEIEEIFVGHLGNS